MEFSPVCGAQLVRVAVSSTCSCCGYTRCECAEYTATTTERREEWLTHQN